MYNSYQVQNQINSGNLELETIYISIDNKDGMSQELSWGRWNEPESPMSWNCTGTTPSGLGSAPFIMI